MIDKNFFEKINCGVLVCKNDQYSTILEANSSFYKMIGYTKQEMESIHKNRFAELVIDDLEEILEKVKNTVGGGKVLDYEYRIKNKSGKTIWIHDIATYDPEMDVFNVVIMDITYREKMLESIYKSSEKDALSQLLNRGALERKIKEIIEGKKVKVQTMILIDLDNLKKINDKLGHQTGDEIITQAGEKLKKIFDKDEIVGRIGGDEFMVYLTDISSKDQIYSYLEKIVDELQFSVEGIKVKSSIGAVYDEWVQYEFKQLYGFSDIALYKVKNIKKGKYLLETV